MGAFITIASFALIIIIIGVINMTGNISSLHWYHRQRVSEEDKLPYGRLVGLGTVIIGLSCVIFGATLLMYEKSGLDLWALIGTISLIIGIAAGIAISFYAMIKYNKGIF